jgi:hypothetical protein
MCAVWVIAVYHLQAADAGLPPLASVSAPVCPAVAGVRSAQSGEVRMEQLMVSVMIQVTRDQAGCGTSVALWVTQNGVSQQIDISETAAQEIGIVDLDPAGSGVLLSFVAEDHSTKAALVLFEDGSVNWFRPEQVQCEAGLSPVGFTDESDIVFALGPPCAAKTKLFSVNATTHATKELAETVDLTRFAEAVSDEAQSCSEAAACYTARARLAVTEGGSGFVLWPVGGKHVMTVADGMVPEDLKARVSPEMRVYATMLICPVRGKPASACVESAKDFKADPLGRAAAR